MDRKGVIGIALAIIVLVAWEYQYAKTVRTAAANRAAAAPLPHLTGTAAASATPVLLPSKPALASAPEEKLAANGAAGVYTFTNLGGGIKQVTLNNYLAEQGKKVTVNALGAGPIGGLTERPGEDARAVYSVERKENQIVCSRTGEDQMEIVKRFTLPQANTGKDQYLVKLDVTYTNRGAQARQSDGYYIDIGSASPIHANDRSTYTGFDWYHGEKGKFVDVNWFSAKQIPLIGIQTSAPQTAYNDNADSVLWAGVTNQYFSTILSAAANPGKRVWAARISEAPPYGIEGAFGAAGFKLEPGQSREEHYELYCGPKAYPLLRKLGNSEDEIINFGWTKWISIFLLNLMNWLKGLFGNYVAAIIVMTICIKSALWIPQNAATKSMKRMQALQPKMTELREKYADDPSRMNQELMKLYKDYGVNPFAGCLPMFIQIPIFFGFFNMLGGAVELRGSGFLWVKDLSQPDTIAMLAGYHINLLPLIMAMTMLWQMSITPKSGDPAQQKMFMFMPLIFVFFCYNFASALSLYYTVQNLFSIAQLYATRNQRVPALQKAAAPKKRRSP